MNKALSLKKTLSLKKILSAVLATAVFCAAFFAAQRLVMPKYMQKPFEGALTAEYYRDSHRSDLLIIGDCEVYENISPVTLWEAYGIPSYIRGNARQLLWQSRAMLEDSLRYETPKVVLLSVLCMIYGESPWDAEPYSRMVFDGMPLSAAKLRALRNSLLPEEEPLSYLFPLLRFHDRWNELGADDFRYFFRRDPVSVNGFVMRADTLAADWIPTPRLLPDYSFGQRAIDALDAITALCGEKGIQLVLFKAPSLMPHWYDEWDTWIADYARTRGLEYLNALALREEIGLDFSSDTYDAGLHLNLAGAEKMARYLGGWLRERCPTLTDRRTEADFAAAWETKTAKYRAWQAAQEHELQQDGELKSVMLYQALR